MTEHQPPEQLLQQEEEEEEQDHVLPTVSVPASRPDSLVDLSKEPILELRTDHQEHLPPGVIGDDKDKVTTAGEDGIDTALK